MHPICSLPLATIGFAIYGFISVIRVCETWRPTQNIYLASPCRLMAGQMILEWVGQSRQACLSFEMKNISPDLTELINDYLAFLNSLKIILVMIAIVPPNAVSNTLSNSNI